MSTSDDPSPLTGDAPSPLFGISRQEHIIDKLNALGSVRVAELSRELGVTEMTVRRDVNVLAGRGLLTRVHGGATLRSHLDLSVQRSRQDRKLPLLQVGMVVPSLTYYWPDIINGAQAAAIASGSRLEVRAATYAAADQRRELESLLETNTINGLIAAPETSGSDGRALLRWLATLPVPVVLAERRAASSVGFASFEWATTDHVHGGALAIEHFATLGHRRVGLVASEGSPTSEHLRRGWDHVIERSGLTCTVNRDLDLERTPQRVRHSLIRQLLEECRATHTTALLIHSDRQAVLVQQFALQHGWRIPEDLTIMAYDDEIAATADPPMSALRPPKKDVGRVAMELLLARLKDGASRARQRVYLLPELRRRGGASVPMS